MADVAADPADELWCVVVAAGMEGALPSVVGGLVSAPVFTEAELVEMGVALALFHGVSKMLIALGCEPEQMDVSIHRTPGT